MKSRSLLVTSFIIFALLLPSSQHFLLAQTQSVQLINIAVNEDYAAAHPGWCDGAKEAFGYVNQIYAKNTPIVFQVNECKTYTMDKRIDAMTSESFYYYNPAPIAYGITVFFAQPSTQDQYNACCTGAEAFAGLTSPITLPDGTLHKRINIQVSGNLTSTPSAMRLLEGRAQLEAQYGSEVYFRFITTLVHELGHTFGTGNPELYEVGSLDDYSGTSPKLNMWFADSLYGSDPMGSFSSDFSSQQFADFDVALINRFINHDFDDLVFYNRASYFGKQVQVTVVDKNNTPIPDATVKIYGMRKACFNCAGTYSDTGTPNPLLTTTKTDAQGHFIIDNFTYQNQDATYATDDMQMAKMYKVQAGDLSGGDYVTIFHLMRAKQVNNSDTYFTTLQLQSSTPVTAPVPAPVPAPVVAPAPTPVVEPTPAPVATVTPTPVVTAPVTELVNQDPASAPELTPAVQQFAGVGMLVKRPDIQAIYFIDNDNRRHAFVTLSIFNSWFPDFSNVTTIPADILSQIPLGSNVSVRPGTNLVKIESDPKVYAVEDYGILRWIPSESNMISLYGNNWASRVIDLPVSLFINYQIGEPINALVHPNGSLIRYAGQTNVYFIENATKRYVPSASFTGNLFQNKFRITDLSSSISYADGADLPVTPSEQLMKLR